MVEEKIESLFGARETTISRDLKMNLKKLGSSDSSLSPTDFGLVVLALSDLKHNDQMKEVAFAVLREAGELNDEMINEGIEVGAIMSMLNGYYKFRRFLRDADPTADETYGAAKLRMQSLSQPKLGHERFELLALAVSIANSCEQCVTSHVEALKKLNVPVEKIHDVARLTASTLGAIQLLRS